MQGERTSDADLAHATRLIRESGALTETMERARLYGRRAIDALSSFPPGRARSAMTEAVARLAAAGVAVTELSLHLPSLDEVFFTLTGRTAIKEEVPA